jgi:hypothetical protein
MRTVIALVVALGLGAGMSAVTAQGQADGKKYDKGATVTLQGCVTAAEKKDTFVLTNVREWPVANSDMGKFGKRYYWVEKSDKLKDHVGHTVQLTGKITDVEKSEIEFKAGENGNGFNVEIEGPGKDIITAPSTADVNPAARPNMSDIPITLLKFKVDEIKMTANNCNATM